jgi:RNA recognition motif-containing protein
MNIYVGNLNFKVDENDLTGIFEEYGAVESAKIITDKFTGRSKGFGFVVMENDDEAQKAIKELNGSTYADREMVVNEARPRKENY